MDQEKQGPGPPVVVPPGGAGAENPLLVEVTSITSTLNIRYHLTIPNQSKVQKSDDKRLTQLCNQSFNL